MFILPFIAALIVSGIYAWFRTGLRTWPLVTAAVIIVVGIACQVPIAWVVTLLVFALIAVPLNLDGVRRRYLSAPFLAKFAEVTPSLSDTEQTVLEAGAVGFESELIAGLPIWT